MNTKEKTKERQVLVFNGIRYDGVFVHPRRKSRYSNRLPSTIWVCKNQLSQILDVAESFGYKYKLVGTVTRYYQDKVSGKVQYNKFRLINPDNVSGLRKPWD